MTEPDSTSSSGPAESILAIFTAAANRALSLDSATQDRLRKLEGRVVAVNFGGLGEPVFVLIENGKIHLQSAYGESVDVTMTGRPADFVALLRANHRGEALAAGRIEISGDLAVAQEVQLIVSEIELDWQSGLAQFVGDIPAHQISRALHGAKRNFDHSARRLEQQLADFLSYELDALPRRQEVEQQRQEIFNLADDVERLAQRIAGRLVGGPKQ